MTKITREDGVNFIIPDYREELSHKKISVLKNEVGMLSKNYGEFIYIQKNLDDSFDVAFSSEPGFLLAESVAKHIKTSDNFIYIERLKNSDNVLFITMKKGKIHIDTQISIEAIHDEFIIIQAEQTPFDIFVYGEIPVTNQEQDVDKIFVGAIAKSFTILEKSIFENLVRYSEFELKAANDAFLSAGLAGANNKKIIMAVAAVIVILIIIWMAWPSQKATPVQQQTQSISTKSEYYDYVQTLKTPGPADQLNGLVKFLQKLQGIPEGWEPASIAINNSTIQVVLTNVGKVENLGELHDWLENKGIDMFINNQSVNLSFITAYPARLERHDIYKTQEILRVLIDRLKPVLNNSLINVSTEISSDNYKELTVTVNVTNASLDTLDIIAKQLSDLPLLFTSVRLTQGNTGLLTGQINLIIVGN